MRIIPRAEWNARPPRSRTTTNRGNRRFFVVHHSAGPAGQTVREIQDWCMDGRGFADIDYNFLIRAGTGEIYEGRGWDVVGSHTVGYNTSGLGVCVIGNNPVVDARTAAALDWLYGRASRLFGRELTIRGHGQLDATACPGAHLAAYLRAGMPAPDPEDDDMKLDDNLFEGNPSASWTARYPGVAATVRNAIAFAAYDATDGEKAAVKAAAEVAELRAELADVKAALATIAAAVVPNTGG